MRFGDLKLIDYRVYSGKHTGFRNLYPRVFYVNSNKHRPVGGWPRDK